MHSKKCFFWISFSSKDCILIYNIQVRMLDEYWCRKLNQKKNFHFQAWPCAFAFIQIASGKAWIGLLLLWIKYQVRLGPLALSGNQSKRKKTEFQTVDMAKENFTFSKIHSNSQIIKKYVERPDFLCCEET